MFLKVFKYYLRYLRDICIILLTKSFMNKNDFKNLRRLKNKHKNEPAILIGGGPSLNKMDLELFSEYVTFACNGFYLKMPSLSWSPTYYTVEDPLPAKDNAEEISALNNTTKIIPQDLSRYIKKGNGETIYVPFVRSRGIFPWLNKFGWNKGDKDFFFWGGTVMYYNIQLANYMGCNPIYLVGVDLSYKIPESVKKNGAVLVSTEDDVNHFDPRYFGKGKKWHLPEVNRMQNAFNKAFYKLSKEGVELINAGVDSKLKNIPKKEIF